MANWRPGGQICLGGIRESPIGVGCVPQTVPLFLRNMQVGVVLTMSSIFYLHAQHTSIYMRYALVLLAMPCAHA
jgi:hypothetical protein